MRKLLTIILALVLTSEPLLAYAPLGTPVGSIQANGGNGTFIGLNNSTAAQTALADLVGQPPFYATNYGATCNGKTRTDITTTASSTTISSTGYTFTSADNGKLISILAGTGVVKTGTLITGAYTVTSIGTTAGLTMGEGVTGTGIPPGAVITGIVSGTQVNISLPATATGSNSLTYLPVVNTTISSTSGGNATLATTLGTSITGKASATFGTADDVGFNAATSAASAAGGGLVVAPYGKCIISASIQINNNVSLTGQGIGKSILYWLSTSDQGANPVVVGFNQVNAVTCTYNAALTNQSNNQITNLEIDGSAGTNASFNVQAKGIGLPCSVRSAIDHVYVHDTLATCIATDTGMPTQITNNVVRNCGRNAGASSGANGIGEGTSGIKDDSGSIAENYIITGNVIINPAHYGAFLESEAGTFQVAGTISDNIIMEGYNSQANVHNASAGIANSGTVGMSITGNYIYGNSSAIQAWGGINIDPGTVAVSSGIQSTISGNHIFGTNSGVLVLYSGNTPTSSLHAVITITGNDIIKTAGPGIEFIPFASGATMDGIEISGNQVIGSGSAGILFAGSGSATNVNITGNILANNGTTLSTYRAAGVAFGYNVTGLTMTGNSIYDNGTGTQLFGIGITTGVTVAGANIQGNTISGNATSAFDLLGTLTGSVQNNYGVDLGTKFTTSGCSISATAGTAKSGTFTLGANTCTAVVTLNGGTGTGSVYTGWTCSAWDQTAPTILIGGNASSTATTASFTIPAGAGTTDVIGFSCSPY